jgi:hypothetical protein
VVLARHPALRAALGSRLLVVLRSLVADAAGRMAASHLTALAIAVSPRLSRPTRAMRSPS